MSHKAVINRERFGSILKLVTVRVVVSALCVRLQSIHVVTSSQLVTV